MRFEAADAEPRQGAFDAVNDTRALPNQRLALAAWPLGVLFFQARHCDHLAVIGLAAQPTEKGALQQRRIEPVGFGPAMLARNRNAVGVDDLRVDTARPQPPRQPHLSWTVNEGSI